MKPMAAAALLLTGKLAVAAPTQAIRAGDFLNSIGANSAISLRGETLEKTIACTKYLGLRWFRSGPEGGLKAEDCIEVHRQTGAKFSWGLLSGGSEIPNLIVSGKKLATAGALLAFEGPNEPNNWGITYQGKAGGRNLSWLPVAALQTEMYREVKAEPLLKSIPVWGVSEDGAETDNVGLQFLTVPPGAGALVPEGTRYSDFANVHNYIYHPNAPGLEDNKTWKAADPSSHCRVDGLFGEYGVTWAKHFRGYSEAELATLPRVTTETGCTIDGHVTEEVHALNLLSLYLDQFKRGWSYTAVYLMRDRSDEGGNQQFGFYKPDYTPRRAALYLHNLTTILSDTGSLAKPGRLDYSIPNEPETVHDLLLQKSNGAFDLVIWSELVKGNNKVLINLGRPVSGLRLFDPTLGVLPIELKQSRSSLQWILTNHPVVIEFPPRK